VTDQFDLFTPVADKEGYQCKALSEAMDMPFRGCCHWCHNGKEMYEATFNEVKYKICCDHIYAEKISNSDIRFLGPVGK